MRSARIVKLTAIIVLQLALVRAGQHPLIMIVVRVVRAQVSVGYCWYKPGSHEPF
jgi:hypothetical protein